MTLSQLFLVLRARRSLILMTILSTAAVVMIFSLVLPKTYKATATLVLNYTGTDPVTGTAYPGQMVPSYVQTQVDIIKNPATAVKVVKDLGLAKQPEQQKKFQKATEGRGNIDDWIALQLLKKLDVTPTRDSNVVEVAFKASDPEQAAAVANAFAAAYQAASLQLKVAPARSATSYITERMKALRDNLDAATGRLSAFQQEKGLSSTDGRYDVESMRLSELSAQLVNVQGQLMDAQSRQRNSQVAGGSESPDVLASPLIQNLRAQVAQAEAKFAQLSERYTPSHPTYRQSKAELDRMRTELNNNVKAASGGVTNTAEILHQREKELRIAVEEQKSKVLDLNQARNQLLLLSKEVDRAQAAYDAAFQRVNQTNLEGLFNQSDAAVLNAATPPFRHSFPNLPLNLVLSLLGGAFLGLGFALLAEMRDRRIRSAADAADALQLPVLATLDWNFRNTSRTPLFCQPAPRLLTQ